jgi:hypothetical protein
MTNPNKSSGNDNTAMAAIWSVALIFGLSLLAYKYIDGAVEVTWPAYTLTFTGITQLFILKRRN